MNTQLEIKENQIWESRLYNQVRLIISKVKPFEDIVEAYSYDKDYANTGIIRLYILESFGEYYKLIGE